MEPISSGLSSALFEEFGPDAPAVLAWLQSKKSKSGRDGYLFTLRQYKKESLDDSLLCPSISGIGRYRSFLDRMIATGTYQTGSAATKCSSLRAFGNFLLSSGRVEENWENRYAQLSGFHQEVLISASDIPTPAMLDAMLKGCVDAREKALLLLVMRCALSTSELLAIRMQDVFHDNRGFYGIRLAGRNASIKIPSSLVPVLDECLSSFPRIPGCRLLFVNNQGKPLQARMLQRIFKNISSRAGYSYTARDIRQASVVYMLAAAERNEGVSKQDVIDYAALCPDWVFRYRAAVEELKEKSPCDLIFGGHS